MPHTVREKAKLLNRTRRIRGQVDAIERALDEHADCAVVLHQIVAVRGAINGLMTHVIEGYILEHLLDDSGHSPEERQQEAQSLISALKTYLK